MVYYYVCLLIYDIIITYAHYKQITLIGYIIERVSILHAIRVSVL